MRIPPLCPLLGHSSLTLVPWNQNLGSHFGFLWKQLFLQMHFCKSPVQPRVCTWGLVDFPSMASPGSQLVQGWTSQDLRHSLFSALALFLLFFLTVQLRERADDGKTLSRAADICAWASFAELLFLEVIP